MSTLDHMIFDGLNSEQRRAVEAIRGTVCILAGAGTGKTTTITRRIANQVASGVFRADQILAVTFTKKAANEMDHRLRKLGVSGVEVWTFHAASLSQLQRYGRRPPGEIMESKIPLIEAAVSSLPTQYRQTARMDLVTEIERTKNLRLTPDSYLQKIGTHAPPIPAELMRNVFTQYEQLKRRANRVDFEDCLEFTIRMYDDDPSALLQLRQRFLAFTVDEYQDVNLLQQTVLERWVGDRQDLCVVGDDYQSIYAFTGATTRYLVELPQRMPGITVITLEANYRSTPEILALANRLEPYLGGSKKTLRAARRSGPKPAVNSFSARYTETNFLIDRVQWLTGKEKVPLEEVAILYRVNYRSADFEEALTRARIPFQIREGGLLTRPAARQLLPALRQITSTQTLSEVRALAERAGLMKKLPSNLPPQEMTRQQDLQRFIFLASEFEASVNGGLTTTDDFVSSLEARFQPRETGEGVNLLTYHRAKGLEFEAVFLPRLEDGELPYFQAIKGGSVDEERRLFYVGITRAKNHLFLTWCQQGRHVQSRFIAELEREAKQQGAGARSVPRTVRTGTPPGKHPGLTNLVLTALQEWRRDRALAAAVSEQEVLDDESLRQVTERMPENHFDLAEISKLNPAKQKSYGAQILLVVRRAIKGWEDRRAN